VTDGGNASDGGPDGTLTDDGGGDAEASTANDASAEASAGDGGPSGLLYYFPLAGDTRDHSGNGHDATNHGATATTGHSGNANGAYMFDGTAAYMNAPGAALPIGGAARTMTLWVNPSSMNRLFGIVSWGQGDCTGLMFGLGSQGGTFWGGCDDAGDGAGIPVGSWTFLAAVFTPPDQMRIFVNAAATGYMLTTPLNTNASSLWIGAETLDDTAADARAYFAGSIDSIRIFDHALSDAEITAVMGL
jgi:hypothetical protein